ncbi:MAG: hypothetical protein ACF8NJ_10360, partial [Phycisphaerales bacterium JB038]
IVKELLQVYDAWFADVSSTRRDNYAPPRIVLGTEQETTTVLTHQDWRRTGEGGGWGPTGKWLLRFEGEHAYDITLIFREAKPVADAVLRLGERVHRQEVGEATATVTIPNLSVSSGELDLQAFVEGDDAAIHAYQVVITRRPPRDKPVTALLLDERLSAREARHQLPATTALRRQRPR